MLPAESLKFLTDLAAKANPQARIVKAPAEPEDVYHILDANGELVRGRALLPVQDRDAADMETLVALAKASHALEPATAELWYGRAGVFFQNLNRHPLDAAKLLLAPSAQLAKLIEWDRAGRARLTQAELVILLRTLFHGCAPENLLPAVRNVKTSKSAEVNSQIAQGKVSLGKSIMAEMAGTAAIPEMVEFLVPVFAHAAVFVVAPVRVAIDPDPQTEAFTLIVLPGDIEHAFALAESNIGNRLETLLGDAVEQIPQYRGRP
jgi:hypothetical protein